MGINCVRLYLDELKLHLVSCVIEFTLHATIQSRSYTSAVNYCVVLMNKINKISFAKIQVLLSFSQTLIKHLISFASIYWNYWIKNIFIQTLVKIGTHLLHIGRFPIAPNMGSCRKLIIFRDQFKLNQNF